MPSGFVLLHTLCTSQPFCTTVELEFVDFGLFLRFSAISHFSLSSYARQNRMDSQTGRPHI